MSIPLNANLTDKHTQNANTTASGEGSSAQTNIHNHYSGVGKPTAAAGIIAGFGVGVRYGAAKPNDGSIEGRVKGWITGDAKDTSEKVEKIKK